MQARPYHHRRSDALAIALLAALIFRAHIPVGFMPAAGSPFLVELCPAYGRGVPAHHGHHHSQDHANFENCPFGSSPAPGPVSQLIAFEPPGRIPSLANVPHEPGRLSTQPVRSHQPRGPPSLA
jgi:hypothetical protein